MRLLHPRIFAPVFLIFFLLACAAPEKELERDLRANERFFAAKRSMERGFIGRARDDLLAAIQLNPSLPGPHYALGIVYMNEKKDGLAEREFQNALDLDEHFYNAYVMMGSLYIRQERFQDAIDAFKKLLDFAPYFPEFRSQNYLGWAYYKKGDNTRAFLALQRALSLSPRYLPARFNMGLTLYSLGKEEASIREFKKAVELDPASPSAHNWLGRIYLKKKKFAKALKEFHAVIANSRDKNVQRDAGEYVKIIESIQGEKP